MSKENAVTNLSGNIVKVAKFVVNFMKHPIYCINNRSSWYVPWYLSYSRVTTLVNADAQKL